jgi:hypothetical protein
VMRDVRFGQVLDDLARIKSRKLVRDAANEVQVPCRRVRKSGIGAERAGRLFVPTGSPERPDPDQVTAIIENQLTDSIPG